MPNLAGLHAGSINDGWDSTGADLMRGDPGWIVFTEAIGSDESDMSNGNYASYTDQGFGVIVRLNHGYGDSGTLPIESRYINFAARVANYIANSTGDVVWCIGNEPNHPVEWPDGQPITPEQYAECFNLCYGATKNVRPDAQICVGGIGPYIAEMGDWVQYLADILTNVNAYDGVILHCYTHGHDPALITSDKKMDPPFVDRHYEFRTYRDFLSVVPAGTNLYITETNPGAKSDQKYWLDTDNGWCQEALIEINEWNETNPDKIIQAVCFYRYPVVDSWAMQNKPNVLEDFRQAVALGYCWTDNGNGEDGMERIWSDSFEGSFHLAGDPYTGESNVHALEIPANWNVSWRQGTPDEVAEGRYPRPEWKMRRTPQREIHTGQQASGIHMPSATHDTALWRTFPAIPGTDYEARIWVLGDSTSDSGHGITIGVDPVGGDDFQSGNVDYQDWYSQYESGSIVPWENQKWVQVTCAVTALADRITVFCRSSCNFRGNPAAVFDDFELWAEEGTPPPGPGGGLTEEDVRRILREEVPGIVVDVFKAARYTF